MLQWTLGYIYLFELAFLLFLGKYLEVKFLGQAALLFLTFWGSFILFSIVAIPIYIPINGTWRFPLLSSPTFVICYLCDDSHSDRCEVVSHCGFDSYFHISVVICMTSLEKCLFKFSAHFYWVVYLMRYIFFVYFMY